MKSLFPKETTFLSVFISFIIASVLQPTQSYILHTHTHGHLFFAQQKQIYFHSALSYARLHLILFFVPFLRSTCLILSVQGAKWNTNWPRQGAKVRWAEWKAKKLMREGKGFLVIDPDPFLMNSSISSTGERERKRTLMKNGR